MLTPPALIADLLRNAVSANPLLGERRPAVRRRGESRALAAYSLTSTICAPTISNANQNGPKGTLDGPSLAYTVNTNDQIRSADDYGEIVNRLQNGAPVRLRDVATLCRAPRCQASAAG